MKNYFKSIYKLDNYFNVRKEVKPKRYDEDIVIVCLLISLYSPKLFACVSQVYSTLINDGLHSVDRLNAGVLSSGGGLQLLIHYVTWLSPDMISDQAWHDHDIQVTNELQN